MPADPAGITAATISIGQTTFAYSYFLPRLSEVRRADPGDSLMRGDVMLGQLAAGAVSMAVGVLLSAMTQSQLPIIVTVFVAVVIAVIYQYAMTGERVMEK